MSSGANYPTTLDLWVNKNSGDDVTATEVNQLRHAVEELELKNFPILRSMSENTVSNTAAETALHSITIGGGKMSTTGELDGATDVFINSMLNNEVLTLKFYWGGVLVWSPQIINVTTVTATNFGIKIIFRIQNRSNASVQVISIAAFLLANTNNLLRFNFTGGGQVHNIVLGGSINTATDQLFQLNAQWTNASSSNSLLGLPMVIRGNR